MRRLHNQPAVPPLVLEFDKNDVEMLIDQIEVLRDKAGEPYLPTFKYPNLVEFFDELAEYLDGIE